MSKAVDILLTKIGKSRADFAQRRGYKGQLFRRNGVSNSAELKRITALPRRNWQVGIGGRNGTAEELVELLTDLWKTPHGTMRLWPIQAVILAELHDFGGVFGPIRTSGGKTLVSFLAAAAISASRPLLIVPGSLVKITKRKWKILSQHWQLPEITIVSYSFLSREENKNYLNELQPDLIIADESHYLKNLGAACTKQVHWYRKDNPNWVFVPLSGTPTNRSLHDYAHLVEWSLPHICPVPLNYGVRVEWALCLDECKTDVNALSPGALSTLCNDAELELMRTDPLSAVRRAFQRRLTDTPGVVSLADEGIQIPLNIRGIDVDIDCPEIDDHFRTLRRTWKTPDGQPFAEAVKLWAHCRELVCGFYYIWFNVDGFKSCLLRTLNEQNNTVSSIEREILNAFVRMTDRDGDLVRAIETLRTIESGSGSTTYELGMGSLQTNIKKWSPNTKASAISVVGALPATRAAVWSLIIATRLAKSEACYVGSVTECSEYLATLLADSPQLYNTFKEALENAKPPKAWLRARSAWYRDVRHILSHNQRRLASEFQVAKACKNGEYNLQSYSAWIAIRDSFKPNNVPIWVHDKTIQLAAEWMDNNSDGIVWTEHRAFAHKLADVTGRPFFGSKGVDKKTRTLIEDAEGPIIASVQSNKEGRDLQHKWCKNLIISAPPNGTAFEQLLARTHRSGQKAESIEVDVLIGCSEQFYGTLQAIRDARYQQEIMGHPQKLMQANISLPTSHDIQMRSSMRWKKGVKK